jgi:DNA polymerase-3 subunit epsilon
MPLDLAMPWDAQPIAVIDFETTGPDPETCAPVEVAVARFEHGEHVRTFQSLINPMMPIPHEASHGREGSAYRGHGITDAMVFDAPTMFDVAPQLAEICADAQPCAFNEPFDRRVMHREITGSECPAFDPAWTWLDVFVIVASPRVDKYERGRGRLKLGACALRWGIELGQEHAAAADALRTGRLLFKLRDRGKVKSVSLGRILAHTREMRRLQDEDHARYAARREASGG